MIRLLLRSSLAHRSETHSPIWSGSKGHSLKARESKTPAVQSRDSIDPHAKESVRARLIERNHAWIDLDFLQSNNFPLDGFAERCFCQEVGPGNSTLSSILCGATDDEAIRSESFFVEEVSRLQTFVHFAVVVLFFELGRLDSQFGKQAARFRAVRKRRFDGNRATVGKKHPTVDVKLVALGMTAEIIVVIENQDASGRILFAAKIRGRQPAYAAARDHQIIGLARFDGRASLLPKTPVALRVGSLERAIMASAHSC